MLGEEGNKKIKLLYHGRCSRIFEPIYYDTDYFTFQCKKCREVSEIVAVILDDVGRIIFDLKCPKCGEFDALKTHPDFRMRKKDSGLSKFYLSSKLRERIGRLK